MVLQIIKSLIKLMGLIAVVYILLIYIYIIEQRCTSASPGIMCSTNCIIIIIIIIIFNFKKMIIIFIFIFLVQCGIIIIKVIIIITSSSSSSSSTLSSLYQHYENLFTIKRR